MTGERSPDEVFADFVVAFDRILEHADDWYQAPRPTSTGSYRAFKVQINFFKNKQKLQEKYALYSFCRPINLLKKEKKSKKST